MDRIKLLVLALLFIGIAEAVPIPFGIDGTVYELDGVTPVTGEVFFSVENLNNGHLIKGVVGRGKPGWYSVVLTGQDGDSVRIRAWTTENLAERVLALEGVMHNVDILLNMTYINHAPEILSTPPLTADEDELYEYFIIADDEDNDILAYSLVQYPDGMSLVGNHITWTPVREQAGNNSVRINVTDGTETVFQDFTVYVNPRINNPPVITSVPGSEVLQDGNFTYEVIAHDPDNDSLSYGLLAYPQGLTIQGNVISWTPGNDDVGTHTITLVVVDERAGSAVQEFNLTVINVNDPPYFTSVPITTAYQNRFYFYDADAEDPDGDVLTYKLIRSPPRMTINFFTGWIFWMARGDHFNITIQVSDGEYKALQSYILNVNPTKPFRRFKNKIINIVSSDYSSPVTEFEFSTDYDMPDIDVNVNIFPDKPSSLKSLDQLVYRYMRFMANSDINSIKVLFKVNNSWLEKHNIHPKDINLYHYDNMWMKLTTGIMDIDELFTYYEAETDHFSYFAIAAENAGYAEPDVAPEFYEPYIVLGEIFLGDDLVDRNYTIENLDTGETIDGVTGSPKPGAYQANVPAKKGDTVRITVDGKSQDIEVTGNVMRQDFQLRSIPKVFIFIAGIIIVGVIAVAAKKR